MLVGRDQVCESLKTTGFVELIRWKVFLGRILGAQVLERINPGSLRVQIVHIPLELKNPRDFIHKHPGRNTRMRMGPLNALMGKPGLFARTTR